MAAKTSKCTVHLLHELFAQFFQLQNHDPNAYN
jgi:hypothetical protein